MKLPAHIESLLRKIQREENLSEVEFIIMAKQMYNLVKQNVAEIKRQRIRKAA